MSGPRAAGLAAVLPLYLALATAVGFVDYHVRPHADYGFTDYAPRVVAGTEEAPGRYRVLAPYALQGLTRLTRLTPVYGWLLFRWLCLVAALLAGHLYLRTWFDGGGAAAGNILVMALLPLTFTNGWPNPDQFTELALFTAACACVARGWTWAFAAALVLNAFNRETSVFLLALFLFARPMSRTRLMETAGLSALWLAIYLGLRWRLGFAPYDVWQAAANLARLEPLPAGFLGYSRIYGWFFLILLTPLFWLAARSWRIQPRFARVACGVVAPLFLIAAFLFSSVIESRIFTPMLPLLAPAALFALFPAKADQSSMRR